MESWRGVYETLGQLLAEGFIPGRYIMHVFLKVGSQDVAVNWLILCVEKSAMQVQSIHPNPFIFHINCSGTEIYLKYTEY